MNTDQLEINKRTLEGHGFNNQIALLEAIMDNLRVEAARLKAHATSKNISGILENGVVAAETNIELLELNLRIIKSVRLKLDMLDNDGINVFNETAAAMMTAMMGASGIIQLLIGLISSGPKVIAHTSRVGWSDD